MFVSRPIVTIATGVLCIAFALARCGGSSRSPGSGSSGSPSSDAGPTDAGPGTTDAGPDAGTSTDAGADGGPAAATHYDVTDIEAVSGAFIVANLNNAGQVFGKSLSGSLIYDSASGSVTIIHPPANVTPVSLNDRGEALFTEESTDASSPWMARPFVQRDFVKTTLPSFGGRQTIGVHLGPNGDVVGHGQYPDFSDHAFLWTPGSSTLRDLGTLGGSRSSATHIAPDGTIVGWSTTRTDQSFGNAFVWHDGNLMELLGVGGPSAAWWQSASGVIVGEGSTIPNSKADLQPLIWAGGEVRTLAKLPGDSFGVALAVNASGDVVGYTDTTPNNSDAHAVLWRSGGNPVRIDSLATLPEGVTLWHGVGINDRGQILAYGGQPRTAARYFLLTPR
jgi:probable HAF family extracellular repeat protein